MRTIVSQRHCVASDNNTMYRGIIPQDSVYIALSKYQMSENVGGMDGQLDTFSAGFRTSQLVLHTINTVFGFRKAWVFIQLFCDWGRQIEQIILLVAVKYSTTVPLPCLTAKCSTFLIVTLLYSTIPLPHCHLSRVSSETSFVSKQLKLEPKLVSALSETRRLFRLFCFNIKTGSFGVLKQLDKPKQQQIC